MTTRISGFATEELTKPKSNALGRVFEFRRRRMFEGGPWVTPVGFGSYRVGMSAHYAYPTCGQALENALRAGLNLIDTSANYGFGESEKLIGHTLSTLVSTGVLRREEIVIVSKVGYIQGPNLVMAFERETQGQGFSNVSKFGDELWHCIHPDFIVSQVESSLERLGVDTIDVYLLHNPEYMLKRFEIEGLSREQAHEKFYENIKESFAALEDLVQKNKIKSYGVSSNTLGFPDDEYTSVSIDALYRVAQEVSPTHHFRVVQCPLNWLEVIPLFYEVGQTGESTLSFAQRHGIAVLTNRPFNAMYNDSLMRLTRPPQYSAEELASFNEGMKKGYENWGRMSRDLEQLAREQMRDQPLYADEVQDVPLSQLVLATLLWSAGVTSVLCGMRTPAYVDDVAAALALPALPHAKQIVWNIYNNLEFSV